MKKPEYVKKLERLIGNDLEWDDDASTIGSWRVMGTEIRIGVNAVHAAHIGGDLPSLATRIQDMLP